MDFLDNDCVLSKIKSDFGDMFDGVFPLPDEFSDFDFIPIEPEAPNTNDDQVPNIDDDGIGFVFSPDPVKFLEETPAENVPESISFQEIRFPNNVALFSPLCFPNIDSPSPSYKGNKRKKPKKTKAKPVTRDNNENRRKLAVANCGMVTEICNKSDCPICKPWYLNNSKTSENRPMLVQTLSDINVITTDTSKLVTTNPQTGKSIQSLPVSATAPITFLLQPCKGPETEASTVKPKKTLTKSRFGIQAKPAIKLVKGRNVNRPSNGLVFKSQTNNNLTKAANQKQTILQNGFIFRVQPETTLGNEQQTNESLTKNFAFQVQADNTTLGGTENQIQTNANPLNGFVFQVQPEAKMTNEKQTNPILPNGFVFQAQSDGKLDKIKKPNHKTKIPTSQPDTKTSKMNCTNPNLPNSLIIQTQSGTNVGKTLKLKYTNGIFSNCSLARSQPDNAPLTKSSVMQPQASSNLGKTLKLNLSNTTLANCPILPSQPDTSLAKYPNDVNVILTNSNVIQHQSDISVSKTLKSNHVKAILPKTSVQADPNLEKTLRPNCASVILPNSSEQADNNNLVKNHTNATYYFFTPNANLRSES